MASRQSEAIVPPPSYPTVNESVAFTSKSDGLPLSSCFWARNIRVERQVIVVQNDVQHDPVDGTDYLPGRLTDGDCGVSISSVQQNRFGVWSCTFIGLKGKLSQEQ